MRKITTLLTAIILLTNTIAFAESRTYKSSSGIFDYTSDGVVTAYYGDELVSVPSDIDGMPIRKIGEMMCFDLGISTVYMEDGIEEIGESAFEGCSATYVDIAASVRTIADRAFANCDCLTDVVLGSENVTFGYDVFMGTGYLNFTVPCTANLEMLTDKISDAKGGNDFGFSIMHNALVESMTEKDIFGENMFYCEDCGFKGSKYLEDISLPFSDVSDDAWYYGISKTPSAASILSAQQQAIEITSDCPYRRTFHSDRGWAYQMNAYSLNLKENRIFQSMSRKGNCYDNSVMENFFGILKQEMYYGTTYYSFDELKGAIERYIKYYNEKRIKEKLGWMSPVEYRLNALAA